MDSVGGPLAWGILNVVGKKMPTGGFWVKERWIEVNVVQPQPVRKGVVSQVSKGLEDAQVSLQGPGCGVS